MRKIIIILSFLFIAAAAFAVDRSLAGPQSAPGAQTSPIHPAFALLDKDGKNVLDSAAPLSTMRTCGQCHDTQFIAGHSHHSDLGWSDFTTPGNVANGRAWDQSSGPFGKWNPLVYGFLSPQDDALPDLSTIDWVKLNAARLAGGGPLVEKLPADSSIEMNCILCHFSAPNHAERTAALQEGNFPWANSAALLGSGLLEKSSQGYSWNRTAFDADGKLNPENVTIQDPTNDNCAQCHGAVHANVEIPLTLQNCDLDDWQTATTGQVFSAQKVSQSGLNLKDKETLTRSFDIHAERGLKCTDCHYALNNPVYYQESGENKPEHLQFDPRRLELGEYLQRPNHNFARGQSAQNSMDPELKGNMRRCESCHNAVDTHDWLPYAERHMVELSCESCHIQQTYAPAIQAYDWTALNEDGRPLVTCRGVQTSTSGSADLVTGFTPALLPRQNINGSQSVAPYNLISAWYWVYDDPSGPRPVRMVDLQAAYFENGTYAKEVLAAFNADSDGALSETELRLDSSAKQALIARRLAGLGLQNPRIEAEIQPYSINHGVGRAEWATQDCKVCHNDDSLAAAPVTLADYTPGGVLPQFVGDANTLNNGQISTDGGKLTFKPAPSAANLYIFGHSRVAWVDLLGALFFAGVLLAVAIHGGYRLYKAIKSPHPKPEMKKVYMYGVYERLWHWLQTFTIVLLLFTGLIIHRPDIFGVFSFRYVVLVHNVLAILLVINAFLSLFYHLASGEIRQFIPRPYGFFDQAILQAKYYLQGIFKNKEHPFEKTPEKKLNPLQQVTYFAILNVLLPLQILSGALMWGVQRWPEVAGWLGGLPILAPFHSLVAWLFAAFIVAHVYLTTTGPQPLTGIEAMINGWEDVEAGSAGEAEGASQGEAAPEIDHPAPSAEGAAI